jgi:hypothetical protein
MVGWSACGNRLHRVRSLHLPPFYLDVSEHRLDVILKQVSIVRSAWTMRTPGQVGAFMEQEPLKVAAFLGSVWSIDVWRHQTYYPISLGRKLCNYDWMAMKWIRFLSS